MIDLLKYIYMCVTGNRLRFTKSMCAYTYRGRSSVLYLTAVVILQTSPTCIKSIYTKLALEFSWLFHYSV